ncbi:1-acylglycerol-3-phosphate O-acyltransferase [Chromatiaceae bacterium AAb-1]|nr:1-acylglycerol-3-phosphate O-acyltransferase [Chromatiaceae bacterium AAb-1]
MLAVVRLFLVGLFLIASTIAGLVVCLFRPFHANNVALFSHWYGKMAWVFGIKVEIRRDPAIKPDQPYVFIANHQNSLDLFVMSNSVLPGTVTIGKKSLRWIPFFGQLYWLSGNILIDRNNKSRAVGTMQGTANRIRRRKLSVWMFPEGTRSYGKGLLPFKMGAFHIALQAQVPLVPVCMSSTHGQFKLNRWNNGKVIIQMMAPVPLTTANGLRQFAEDMHERMAQQISQLDAELANDYTAGNITVKG